jgi:hypothetical protein
MTLKDSTVYCASSQAEQDYSTSQQARDEADVLVLYLQVRC